MLLTKCFTVFTLRNLNFVESFLTLKLDFSHSNLPGFIFSSFPRKTKRAVSYITDNASVTGYISNLLDIILDIIKGRLPLRCSLNVNKASVIKINSLLLMASHTLRTCLFPFLLMSA